MTAFPAGWALMKPQQTIDPAEFNRLWRQGNMIPTRKRDGNRAHIVTGGGSARVYSRNGTLDWTDKVPHIAHAFGKAPSGLLLDVELHTPEEGTWAFQEAMNKDPEQIVWSAFDILKTDGSLTMRPYRERSDLIMQLTQAVHIDHDGGGVFFHLPETATYDDVLTRIAKAKCEGVVMWDATAPHIVNTNGNTKRGRSWKIKPKTVEDLMVTAVTPSKDPALGVGTIKVSRRCEATGTITPIKAALGSFDLGFDRRAALTWPTPFVVEVSHFGEDDNGNLVFPKVLRPRFDLHADFGIATTLRAA